MHVFWPQRLKIDLQLFAEKTEQPTGRKKEQAAQKGQIAKSPEINSTVVLLATFVAIKVFMPFMVDEWTALTANLFSMFTKVPFELDYRALQTIFLAVLVSSGRILAPIIAGALIGGLASTYFQIGFRFSPSAVAFNLNNINPIEGLKRMFSIQSLAELIKSIIKLVVIGYVAYSEYMKELMSFTQLADMNLRTSSAFVGNVTLNVVFKILLWMAILAVADYIFQKGQNLKQLMMSKEEIKEEHKMMEGDPQLKAKIKQKQRQLSMTRMMHALPKADVVITNPTHFAVALQYDSKTMGAPLVIAKGQDRIALKIKEVAKEHNITIVENKPLAQSLFRSTEIGDAIPLEMFQAVAEVLAFVYKLKGKI